MDAGKQDGTKTIASFNFHIVYCPGKMSDKLDALSRLSNHKDIPNPVQTMIAAERFLGFRATDATDIITAIREAQEDDESMSTLISSTREKGTLP